MKRFLFPLLTVISISLAILAQPWRATASPGPTALSIEPLDASTSQIVAHNVGVNPGAQPATSWDIFFSFPEERGRLARVTPGPDWEALDCGFAVNLSSSQTAPALEPNQFILNGFCTTRIPPGLVKDQVVIATLHWEDCRSGFVVDLRTGEDQFGEKISDIIDVGNNPYLFTDDDLFDGGACGDTTQGAQGTRDYSEPAPSPLTTSAPLLAALVGLAILLAGGAAAFWRRRK